MSNLEYFDLSESDLSHILANVNGWDALLEKRLLITGATKAKQIEMLRQYVQVVTIEDHLQDLGFGSWMLEAATMTEEEGVSKQATVEYTAFSTVL